MTDTSPSLGWLEAYLAAAKHLNYEAGGREIGRLASAQRSVERLERWLHRLLLMSGTPLEFAVDPILPDFRPVAAEILEVFDACSTDQARVSRARSLKRSKRSLVRLSDIQTVLMVGSFTNYDSAASHLACSYKTVRDRIRTVETALGGTIFEGRSTVSFTPLGETFKFAGQRIEFLLESARHDVTGHDGESIIRERNLASLRRYRLRLASIASIGSSTRSVLLRKEVYDARTALAHLYELASMRGAVTDVFGHAFAPDIKPPENFSGRIAK